MKRLPAPLRNITYSVVNENGKGSVESWRQYFLKVISGKNISTLKIAPYDMSC